jgi:hypothetical protein
MSFSFSRFQPDVDPSRDRDFRGLDVTDDLLLQLLWSLADWAVAYVGPMFWLCLAAMFLRALRGG